MSNLWPRQHFGGNVRDAADSLTRASRKFLLALKAGERPPVPDSVWHGNDCWVLETHADGWHVNEFAREVADYLAKWKSLPQHRP